MTIAPAVLATFEDGTNGSSVSGLTGVSAVGGTAPTVTTTSPLILTKSCISASGGVSSYFSQTFAANDTVATVHYFDYNGTPGTVHSFLRIMADGSTSTIQARIRADGFLEVIDLTSNVRWVSPAALPAGDYGIFVTATKGTTTSNGHLTVKVRKLSDGSTYGTDVDITNANCGTVQFTLVRHGKTGTGGIQHKMDYCGYTLGTHDTITPYTAVTMNAGTDQTDVDAYTDEPLDASASVGSSAGTWTQISGAAATIANPANATTTYRVPGTINGDTLVFRRTDTATGLYDEVSHEINPSAVQVLVDGVWKPGQEFAITP